MRWLLAVTVSIRVLAAIVLIAGPWTDEADDLEGWDVARFQEIADAPGRHWVDHEVEYPPGTALLVETLARDHVVETHRLLVASSLAVDLAVAALVGMMGGRRASAVYLVLGLPLVPMGLLRFDLWSVALAVVAVAALGQRKPAAFAGATTAAAMVKVWPVVLLAPAIALRRRAATVAALATMAGAGLAWLAYGGWSLDPLDQVLSLRGATGWHVESIGGTLSALTTEARPERQLDAFRIGELDESIVLFGRLVTVAVATAFVALGRRVPVRPDDPRTAVTAASVIMLGTTAALIVTAPLLSPQFLLWLTPWAALAVATPVESPDRWLAALVILTGVATTVTGAVLAAYGPPDLAEPTPAVVLGLRNLVLIAIVIVALVVVARRSRGAEHPLGQGGPGPRPARADA